MLLIKLIKGLFKNKVCTEHEYVEDAYFSRSKISSGHCKICGIDIVKEKVKNGKYVRKGKTK